MKKKLFAVLMAAAMVFGMTACGSGESAETTAETTGEETQLEDFTVVLDWYPNAVHAFLYDAIEKGYFAEEGLNLVIQFPANTNDGISLPAAGKADAGVYYMQDAIMTSCEENVPIVSIGAVTQKSMNVVISLKDSGITEAKDLAGKKIGYAGTVLSEAQIQAMLQNAGLTADDCECIDVGFDLMSALTTGQVDATIGNMVNHEVPQMEEQGFEVNYFYPTDFGEKYQGFLRACQKGFEDMKNNPDEVLQILLDNQNEANFPLSENVERQSMEILLPDMETESAPFLHQEVSVWQENADWMYEVGVLTKEADVSGLVVNLLEDAQ